VIDEHGPLGGEAQAHVERWLRAHGVTLEMKVAGAMRDSLSGFTATVDHARAYIDADPVTGAQKLREIDVVARVTVQFGDVYVALWVVAECKSSNKTPWLLYRSPAPTDFPLDSIAKQVWKTKISGTADSGRVGGVFRTVLSAPAQSCYSIASTQGGNNEKNHAMDAVQQVLSATDGALRDLSGDMYGNVISVYVPVIVTSAPLFAMVSIEPDLEIEATDIELLYGRFSPDETLRAVWVIHESALSEFARQVARTAAYLDYRSGEVLEA
jgi:hypothetical protein